MQAVYTTHIVIMTHESKYDYLTATFYANDEAHWPWSSKIISITTSKYGTRITKEAIVKLH